MRRRLRGSIVLAGRPQAAGAPADGRLLPGRGQREAEPSCAITSRLDRSRARASPHAGSGAAAELAAASMVVAAVALVLALGLPRARAIPSVGTAAAGVTCGTVQPGRSACGRVPEFARGGRVAGPAVWQRQAQRRKG